MTKSQVRNKADWFQKKIRNELKRLEKSWPLDNINWEEFVSTAEQARETYLATAQDFTIRLMEKRNAANN